MKQWLIFAVKAAVSVLLIWWLVERIDPAPVVEALERVSAALLLAAVAAMSLASVVLALRWRLVSAILGIVLDRGRALRLTLIGLFFSQTLPSTIGGDVARIWLVYRQGVPMVRAASSVLTDRLVGLAALLAVVTLSLPASIALIDDPTPRWSIPVLVVFGFAGFTILLVLGGGSANILDRWAAMRPLSAVARDLRQLLAGRDGLLRIFAMALAIHALAVFAVWLIGRSVAAEITMLHCLIFVPPVVLVSMVPVSVAGWGIREGAMVVAFGFVGVPAASALAVSLLFGLVQVAVGVPGGVLWLENRRAVPPVPDPSRAGAKSES